MNKALATVLAKLNKLTYVDYKGNDTLLTKEGFEVRLGTEFHHSKNGGFSLSAQVVLYVIYNKQRVTSWGCEGLEDQKAIVDWFIQTKVKAGDSEWTENKRVQKLGKDIFDNLLNA